MHFTKKKCISTMVSICNMLTLWVAGPCSRATRMVEVAFLRVAFMPLDFLLLLKQ
jgi:hypothetical protein